MSLARAASVSCAARSCTKTTSCRRTLTPGVSRSEASPATREATGDAALAAHCRCKLRWSAAARHTYLDLVCPWRRQAMGERSDVAPRSMRAQRLVAGVGYLLLGSRAQGDEGEPCVFRRRGCVAA